MKKIITGLAVVSVAVIAVTSVANADNSNGGPPDDVPAASSNVRAPSTAYADWGRQHANGKVSDAAADDFAGALQATEDQLVEDRSASLSISYPDGRQINVVPTQRGGLCTSFQRGAELPDVGCGDGFASDGTAVISVATADGPPELYGVVASDVTSLTITTTDGEEHPIAIDRSTVWWVGERGTHIKSMRVIRHGKAFDSSDRFSTADPG